MGKRAQRRRKELPSGVAEGQGIQQEAVHKAHATLTDPGSGRHMWVMLAMYSIARPEEAADQTVFMDVENLLNIEGPGCFKCEKPYTAALAARPCPARGL